MINLKIDGQNISVQPGTTILEAADSIGIKIPRLCYHPELRPEGACRVCMVEVKGARGPVASCVYPVAEGMEVHTNTGDVREARKTVIELLLANHPTDCLRCIRNHDCELQQLAADYGIREVPFSGEQRNAAMDHSNPSLVRDPNKCILCGRCIRMCSEIQNVNCYSFTHRGFDTIVSPAFNVGLGDAACTFCGQCSSVCPTAAITEKDDTEAVWAELGNPDKHVIIFTAPSVRSAIGEEFGLENGLCEGKMVAALRRLGFDQVFDANFTADLTIIEEGSELINRVTTGGKLPQITSCSPGWVNFIEVHYPELLPHLSSAKSPAQMMGALIKTYYAEKKGIDPASIYVVFSACCTAKKFEAARPEMNSSGFRDVDAVITTRETARMIRAAGIQFAELEDETFDNPLGASSGGGLIFAASGGVMEAALRFAVDKITGTYVENVEYKAVRGMQRIKEAEVVAGELKLKVAAANTLGAARILMEQIKSGESPYAFIEIMACPGGCLGGGGQPIPVNASMRQKRMDAIYQADSEKIIRKPQDNPYIKKIYEEFLGEPNGHKAHELLHTHFHWQKREVK